MGIAEIIEATSQLVIHANIILYGDAADDQLASALAANIAAHWNEPKASVNIGNRMLLVHFDMKGIYANTLQPVDVYENDNPLNNYYRVEVFSELDISSVDGINSNTGYFKLDNLLNNSTTAAHEFGHSIGLEHPRDLDLRGKGQPGIMYPRGTIVDPEFQYDPAAAPAAIGGTMNPFLRKVLTSDIELLRLHKLSFNKNNQAIIGDFSSVWHDRHA